MCSRALPSPFFPPPPPGETEAKFPSNSPKRGKGMATCRLPWDPCDISIGGHAFLLAFSGYSRSVEAHNCRSDRRETGTQIGHIGKTENRFGYQIRKPVTIFRGKRNHMLNNGKSANRSEHQNGKTEGFCEQKASIEKLEVLSVAQKLLSLAFFYVLCDN